MMRYKPFLMLFLYICERYLIFIVFDGGIPPWLDQVKCLDTILSVAIKIVCKHLTLV